MKTKRAINPRGNYSHSIASAEKDRRREEGKIRQAEYDKLTPEQKLARLDAGQLNAVRQRAKLDKLIGRANTPSQQKDMDVLAAAHDDSVPEKKKRTPRKKKEA